MPSPILLYFYIKIEFLFYKKNSIYYYKLYLTMKKMPRMCVSNFFIELWNLTTNCNNDFFFSFWIFFFLQIQEFTKGIAEYPLHSNGLIDVPKSLADIVESTIGAIFVDCDSSIKTVWKVLIHFSLFWKTIHFSLLWNYTNRSICLYDLFLFL